MDLSVTTRSGRTTKVTTLGQAELAQRVAQREAREAKLLKATLIAERNSVAAPPEDPGFVHSMVPPSNAHDSDSDGDADRTTYLLGAIKVRDGRDHTKAVKSGTMSLDELEKLWATLVKAVLPSKTKKSKSKSKAVVEGHESDAQYAVITPSASDHPMKKKANTKVLLLPASLAAPAPSIPSTAQKRPAGDLLTPPTSQRARVSIDPTPLRRTDSSTVVFGKPLQHSVYSNSSSANVAAARLANPGASSISLAPRFKSKPVATMPGTPNPTKLKPPAATFSTPTLTPKVNKTTAPITATPNTVTSKTSAHKQPVPTPTHSKPTTSKPPTHKIKSLPAQVVKSGVSQTLIIAPPRYPNKITSKLVAHKTPTQPRNKATSVGTTHGKNIAPTALGHSNSLRKNPPPAANDIIYLDVEDSDVEELSGNLSDTHVTTTRHKLKPKLGTFNPRKSRKFVKIAGNRVLAALLASGGYDDNLPAQARNRRRPEDLQLIEPLTVDTWAEVCAEFGVNYPFTTALVKWIKAQLTTYRGRVKDASLGPIKDEVGFGDNPEANKESSALMLPHAFHSLNKDASNQANFFLDPVLAKLVAAAVYSRTNNIAVDFPKLFTPVSIGLIAYALTMGNYVISGYAATGIYAPDQLCATVQGRTFEFYYSLVKSMSAATPNRLVDIQVAIRDYAKKCLGINPTPGPVAPLAEQIDWGQDSKPRGKNPFAEELFAKTESHKDVETDDDMLDVDDYEGNTFAAKETVVMAKRELFEEDVGMRNNGIGGKAHEAEGEEWSDNGVHSEGDVEVWEVWKDNWGGETEGNGGNAYEGSEVAAVKVEDDVEGFRVDMGGLDASGGGFDTGGGGFNFGGEGFDVGGGGFEGGEVDIADGMEYLRDFMEGHEAGEGNAQGDSCHVGWGDLEEDKANFNDGDSGGEDGDASANGNDGAGGGSSEEYEDDGADE